MDNLTNIHTAPLDASANSASDLRNAALAYARAGWRVFPCAPDGTLDKQDKPSKKPLTRNGKDDATTDAAQIAAWWAQCPNANIGGLLPPGIAAIDIDDKPGKFGSQQWAKLPGDKPETITTKSPNGRHLFYAGDVGSTNDERIAPDIDLRGSDGKFYLILAPSVVDGRLYDGPIAPDPKTMTPLPAWIAAASPKGRVRDRGKGNAPGEPQADIADIAQCLAKLPNGDASWDDYNNVGMAVWRASGGTEAGFALFDAWAAKSRKHDVDDTRERWEHWFQSPPSDVGWDALCLRARYPGIKPEDYGVEPGEWPADAIGGSGKLSFADAMKQLGLDLGAAEHQREPDPPRVLMHAVLMASDFKPPEYVWEGWVLRREVNLVYGDGKTGKTMLSLHLAVARAAGIALFGKTVQPGAVLIITTEDKFGAIKQSVGEICKALGVDPRTPLPIAYSCCPRIDTTLADVDNDGSWQPGMFLRTAYEDAKALTDEHGEVLIILDPIVNLATLDENLRPPAHTLCQVVLPGYCDYLGATVVVDAHPSAQQMRSRRGGSGSTGWRNATRNMLVLERDDPENLEDPARSLRSGGSNYGAPEPLHLNLDGPVFSINVDWHETQQPKAASAFDEALAILPAVMMEAPGYQLDAAEIRRRCDAEFCFSWATAKRARLKLPITVTQNLGAQHAGTNWKWTGPVAEVRPDMAGWVPW